MCKNIILSRKGFDSSFGGCPSPILPDGTLLSIPIPEEKSQIKYSQLSFAIEGKSCFDIMKDLYGEQISNGKKSTKLSGNLGCHLDPDIDKNMMHREKQTWKGLFGQAKGAQKHLSNKEVGEGDIFLFFGWFKRAEKVNGSYKFIKNAPDLHVIFGYLQIGKIVSLGKEQAEKEEWMENHPHVANKYPPCNNTLYVARDTLTLASMPGCGRLKLGKENDSLILTAPSKTRSVWGLNRKLFDGLEISYHSKSSWRKDGLFQSAKIGQEFVIDVAEKSDVIEWAKGIITSNVVG